MQSPSRQLSTSIVSCPTLLVSRPSVNLNGHGTPIPSSSFMSLPSLGGIRRHSEPLTVSRWHRYLS
jgi:hypothetical protein